MKKNINTQDRLLRAGIGIVALIAAFWFKSLILTAIGIFSLYEAFVGWCLFYQIIGKNSCPLE